MIVKREALAAALDRPDPERRFYLFHGPDEAGARALAARLQAALGADKFALSASALRDDPALLADEAAAIALFGGPRLIWIEPAGDEIAAAVEALLGAPRVESPVVAVAGALRKTGALLKLVENHAQTVVAACYAPEGADAERMVVALGQAEGLAIDSSLARRIAEESAGNQAIAAAEIGKFALFLNAVPDRPATLSHDVIDALGCGGNEGNVQRLGDLALAGDLAALFEEMDRAGLSARDCIPALRALERRLLGALPLNARVAGGEKPAGVMTSAGRAIFWKDKGLVEGLVRRWPAERLARLLERTIDLELDMMLGDAPEAASLGEHLTAVGRTAQRLR